MEERRDNNGIDEAYFNTICEKLPFLRALRANQEPMGNNYFSLLIHFFKKFSTLESNLHLERDPQRRYELLFNIIEIGNLVDTMRLVEYCNDMKTKTDDTRAQRDIDDCIHVLLTLKRYRNVVADGYHVYETKTSTEIIPSFQTFFRELGARRPTQQFFRTSKTFKDSMYKKKDESKHVNSREDIFRFITTVGAENSEDAEKQNVCALLQGIKYFLDKAAVLYKDDKKDCASLYFIAGANCARDFENFFCEKIVREVGQAIAEPQDNIDFHRDLDDYTHVFNLLICLRDLRQDRGQQFAHKVGEQKQATAVAMKKKISDAREAREYISRIYRAIDFYLEKAYGIPPSMAEQMGSIQLTDDASPRPYLRTPVMRRGEAHPRMLLFEEPRQEQVSPNPKRERSAAASKLDIPAESDKAAKRSREITALLSSLRKK